MWDPGLDPEPEKEHSQKKQNTNKVCRLVNCIV